MVQHYDLVVIGSGPAGEKGATTAALLGKRVALIEKDSAVGGASTNTGTLPSKTLRETALALSGLRARDLFGVDLSLRREATIRDLMYHEGHVKQNMRRRVRENLSQGNTQVYQGMARFADPHTIELQSGPDAGMRLTADVILLATGSAPVRPPLFPFEDDRVHDSDEILQLDRVPKSLAVIGAGVIGSEYACTFAALGTEVCLIDGRDSLLPFLDREVAAALVTAMEDLGIVFHWREQVVQCDVSEPAEVLLTCASGRTLRVDGVLVAAGRTSNTTSLNLSAAGITPGPRGVLTVDEQYRTSVPHIYAAGDVIGFPALASTSAEQARAAMHHAFGGGTRRLAHLLPTGIYTIPEASMVGETEEALRARGEEYVVGCAPYGASSRGEIIGDRNGFLKLLFRRADMRLLGVHVIGEQATELVHIGLMAMLTRSGAELFQEACFNVPTLGDLYKTATLEALMSREQKPVEAALV